MSDADDTDTVPLNVPMPRQLHARMKSKAALTGRTIRRFVIEAVTEKLEREEAPPPQRRRGQSG